MQIQGLDKKMHSWEAQRRIGICERVKNESLRLDYNVSSIKQERAVGQCCITREVYSFKNFTLDNHACHEGKMAKFMNA